VVGLVLFGGVARSVGEGSVQDRELIRGSLGWALARYEPTPCLVTLVDDLSRILFVLRFTGKCKLVLGLAIRDLVDPEPLVRRTDETGEVVLDVLNIVQFVGERIINVDNDDFPVGLALVEESHNTEDLDLLDLAGVADLLTDLTDVERVVVTLGLGFWVGGLRVFPGLRESTVVPDITVVGEAVANETQTTLLNVLLDGVESLLLGYLHLRIGPPRDLDNHVEDTIVGVGEEGDVMEGRNDGVIVLLDEDTVFKSISSADLACGVLRHPCGH